MVFLVNITNIHVQGVILNILISVNIGFSGQYHQHTHTWCDIEHICLSILVFLVNITTIQGVILNIFASVNFVYSGQCLPHHMKSP